MTAAFDITTIRCVPWSYRATQAAAIWVVVEVEVEVRNVEYRSMVLQSSQGEARLRYLLVSTAE